MEPLAACQVKEVRVQDRLQACGPGIVPQSLAVVLFGDLVGGLLTVFRLCHRTWRSEAVQTAFETKQKI
eukprot:6012983-Amphidinium_carterae.1